MGADLFDLSAVQEKLEQAQGILGWSIAEICQSPDDLVSKTRYTQPCLYTVESLLVDLMQSQGHQPDFVAGHSLGEYVALYAAGVFDFEAGLRLVKQRAELMDNASEGGMAALLGFDRAQLEQQIAQTPGVVLANDNNEAQVVISGTAEAIDAVIAQVKTKRSVKLNVSGAFHSPMMAGAAAEYEQLLAEVEFREARVPLLSNVDPSPAIAPQILKERLQKQMTGSVRWREITLRLPQEGVTEILEIGPGKVLVGIMKRGCPDVTFGNRSLAAEIL